jgi:hypothetical protein
MDAAVVTDVPAAERAGIAAEIAALSARLRASTRPDGPLLTRRATACCNTSRTRARGA